MSDFMRQWAKDIKNERMGKIYRSNAGYIFTEEPWTNQGGHTFPIYRDADGRGYGLRPGQFVHCPNPPAEAPLVGKYYSVRLGACNKCANRLPNMCCKILRDKGRDAHIKALTQIVQAVQTANDIVGRP